MTTLNDREPEEGGTLSQEDARELEAIGRRNQMLGLWAAGLMGLENDHLNDYAAAVVKTEIAHGDGEAIARKVARDLSAAGLKISEDQVRGKMDELLAQARGQIGAGN